MNNNQILERIKNDVEVKNIMAWPIDFDLSIGNKDFKWFDIKPNDNVMHIACDGTGGVYILAGIKERLAYISSDGEAGVIAKDLEEGICLIINYPYWRDILKFSHGGRIDEMRRVVPYLERELKEDEPQINKYRSLLKNRLEVKCNMDIVNTLYYAVKEFSKEICVSSKEGEKYASLFNNYTVESNPTWKME